MKVQIAGVALVAAAGVVTLAVFLSKKPDIPGTAEETKPLKVGATAPDASLKGLDGKDIKLSTVLNNKPTVIIFYRGGWCPFCNFHLSELVKVEGEIRKRGYQLIAISPELPSELVRTVDRDHLNYKLFSDTKAEAMKRFGVAFKVDGSTLEESYRHTLELSSGQTHHLLPVPSVFVVDKTGKITFAYSNPNYTSRLKGSEILATIPVRIR